MNDALEPLIFSVGSEAAGAFGGWERLLAHAGEEEVTGGGVAGGRGGENADAASIGVAAWAMIREWLYREAWRVVRGAKALAVSG